MAKKLSEKQKKLAINLSQGMTDIEAYIKAGYSKKTAKGNASNMINKLLNNKEFNALIAKDKKLVKNAPKVSDLYTFWIDTFKNEDIDINSRLKASELLAKAEGLFVNKVEIKNDNYSDILNNARKRLSDINTINITPENIDNNNTDTIVN